MYLNGNIYVAILLIGVTNCTPYNRVVNGTDSDIMKYPFVVSMRNTSGHHFCGASIITSQFILTAAHCVDGRTADEIQLQFANTQINVNGTNVVPVKRIIIHERYDLFNSYSNDIALLELPGFLVFNYKTFAPVTLPEPYYEVPQECESLTGVLVGWGRNQSDGPAQIHLQEVTLKIYSDKECRERHDNVTTNHQICGGVDEGYKGQCSGDSGGPLIYDNHIQLGIVSWSIKPCTRPPYPGVYTKVSHYVHWIYTNMNK